jgi:hypothetical protein
VLSSSFAGIFILTVNAFVPCHCTISTV